LYLAAWDRVKQEVTFAITNANVKVKRDIAFLAEFDEVEVVGGKEAVPVLDELVREVEGILLAIERPGGGGIGRRDGQDRGESGVSIHQRWALAGL
jgi:hypothetical protein